MQLDLNNSLEYGSIKGHYFLAIGSLLVLIFVTYKFFRFLSHRFEFIEDFFESIKYRAFSRNYLEKNKSSDNQPLYKGFNTVNKVVRE